MIPISIFFVLIFLFGTIIGSFLNVVILRYNTGKNIFGPRERSICLSCGKKLAWYELVPVVSFCFLRARCSGCHSPISWQYPLVEITTGVMFVSILLKGFALSFNDGGLDIESVSSSIVLTLLYWAIWSILTVITVYDLRHKIIPNGLVYSFVILSFICAFLFPVSPGGAFLGPLFAGLAFFAVFAGLWVVSGGRWLGFGDAKLVLGVGFLLGFSGGLSALTLAFWIGAVVSIILLAVGGLMKNKVIQESRLHRQLRNLTMKSEIPFAPFIILGSLIVFFWQIDIFRLGSLF